MPLVYLDNNATTRTDPRVVSAMLPYFTEHYGNAASRHSFGHDADAAVKDARERIAALLGVAAAEVVFTSGATESNNLALRGVMMANRRRGNHLVITTAEHKSVLDPAARLEREGLAVTRVPVDGNGQVDPAAIADALTDQTVLVSVILANNEVGTINPVAAIAEACHARGVLVHTDATQAVGKTPVNGDALGVDLLSLSAHKLYGPKGVGALVIRRRRPRVRIEALLDGGGHERGFRSGTLPVPLIVGFAAACDLAETALPTEALRIAALRDRLESQLFSRLPGVRLNGHPTERLPGTSNLMFTGIEAEAMLLALKDVALSPGSACTSADPEPSHVLLAMGRTPEEAHSSLRFGIGRFNTDDDIGYAIHRVMESATALRLLHA